jgi:hypothetical protein
MGPHDLADPKQTNLINADGRNNKVRILKREDHGVVGSFGRSGRLPANSTAAAPGR